MLLIFVAVLLYLPTTYGNGGEGDGYKHTMNRGVWKGKVGDKDIVACFNGDYDVASYYYLKYKNPIQLNKSKMDMTWEESEKTGTWVLKKIEDGKVKGIWSNNSKDKELPIELTYIATEKGCGGDEYNAVLEYVPSIEMGKITKFKDKKYRTLRVADVETLELLSDVGMTKEINKQLYSMLPKTKKNLEWCFETRRKYLESMGFPQEDYTSVTPYYWSSDYVTIHFYRWAAGTGRSGISLDYRTWNIKTAKEVNLWSWFDFKADSGSDIGELPSLKKYLSGLKVDDACKDDYQYNTSIKGNYHLTLEDNGMKFWEEPFGTGCEKEFLIPYSKIGAFMNAKGKEALRILFEKMKSRNVNPNHQLQRSANSRTR